MGNGIRIGGGFVLRREAIRNPDDGGRTTVHAADVVFEECGKVVVSSVHPDRHQADNEALELHRDWLAEQTACPNCTVAAMPCLSAVALRPVS